MKKVIIIISVLILGGCVSTKTFKETTNNINSRIYSLDNKLNSANSELSQANRRIDNTNLELQNLRSELYSTINSNKDNSEKIELLEQQLRQLDEIIGRLRLQTIRNR